MSQFSVKVRWLLAGDLVMLRRVCRPKMIKTMIKGIHIRSLSLSKGQPVEHSPQLSCDPSRMLSSYLSIGRRRRRGGLVKIIESRGVFNWKWWTFWVGGYWLKASYFDLIHSFIYLFLKLRFIRGWCFKMDAVTWKRPLSQRRATSTCTGPIRQEAPAHKPTAPKCSKVTSVHMDTDVVLAFCIPNVQSNEVIKVHRDIIAVPGELSISMTTINMTPPFFL